MGIWLRMMGDILSSSAHGASLLFREMTCWKCFDQRISGHVTYDACDFAWRSAGEISVKVRASADLNFFFFI